MSDEPEPEAKDAHAPAAAGGAKPPKAVMLLLILNLGLSGFAAFKVATAKPAHGAPAGKEAHEAAPPPGNEVTGTILALDPFIVNLNETGTSRYLKATIQLELSEHDAEKAIEKNKQVIRDDVLSYLSGLSLKDTLGAKAKDKIRADLLGKIEDVIGTHRVRRMFFQEFMVQ